MCGRARCVLSPDAIEASTTVPKTQFRDFHNYQPQENMTPGQRFPVLFSDPQSGARVVQVMTWGLIPSFTSSQIDKPDYFKVRSDSPLIFINLFTMLCDACSKLMTLSH